MPCVFLVTSWVVACQAPLFVEFSRQEYWSGLPFPLPGDLTDPGIKPVSLASPALTSRFSTTAPPWKAYSGKLHSVISVYLSKKTSSLFLFCPFCLLVSQLLSFLQHQSHPVHLLSCQQHAVVLPFNLASKHLDRIVLYSSPSFQLSNHVSWFLVTPHYWTILLRLAVRIPPIRNPYGSLTVDLRLSQYLTHLTVSTWQHSSLPGSALLTQPSDWYSQGSILSLLCLLSKLGDAIHFPGLCLPLNSTPRISIPTGMANRFHLRCRL